MNHTRLISVVLPLRNEASSLRALHQKLSDLFQSLPFDAEFIFIDDGSTDQSTQILRDLHDADPRVKAIFLTRNFGQQAAITAGLDAARGDAVVTMDTDLQHPPELIKELVSAWQAGNPVVYGVRRSSRSAGLIKRMTSSLFYRLFEVVGCADLPRGAGEMRLIDRRVLTTLQAMPERHRFIRGLVAWTGFRSARFPYDAEPRRWGRSSYSLLKMLMFGIDAVLSFSAAPIYFTALAGGALLVVGVLYFFHVLYTSLVIGTAIVGWPSVTSLILIVGGFQMLMMALIGLYVAKMYQEVKHRPLYVVDERLGCSEAIVESAP